MKNINEKEKNPSCLNREKSFGAKKSGDCINKYIKIFFRRSEVGIKKGGDLLVV